MYVYLCQIIMLSPNVICCVVSTLNAFAYVVLNQTNSRKCVAMETWAMFINTLISWFDQTIDIHILHIVCQSVTDIYTICAK